MRSSISFLLNGVKKEVSGDDLFLPLSSFLRYEKRLTGTKVVCAEGDCGACTVMLAKGRPDGAQSEYIAVNSCIAMAFSLDGASLVTVEGLSQKNELSEVQCSMVRNFGGQCGFCTPGFVMAITNMYEQKQDQKVTEQNAKNYLTGNLCRCTGYAPIVQAALDVDIKKHQSLKNLYPVPDLSLSLQEAIFVKTQDYEYFAPTTLTEACEYKSKNPEVIIFSGATDLGVRINKGNLEPKKILSLHLISELYTQKIENGFVYIGARVTLAEMQKLIEKEIPSLDHFLNIFASPQIKNSATLVGNLANASPIADTTPVMMALDAELEIIGQKGRRDVALKDFYLGYKKLNLQPDEVIVRVKFKMPASQDKMQNYKISQRRDLDISTVNASFKFSFENNKITQARLVFGGVAATTLRLEKLENELQGKEFDRPLVDKIKQEISQTLQPMSDVRGTDKYRKLLAVNLFERFAHEECLL